MRIGIYPGSFDPMTNGHLDLIKRSVNICDKLVVAIGINSTKEPLFSFEERKEMILECLDDIRDKVEVIALQGMIVDYCKDNNISLIVKGLRSTTDFEYELAIASANKKLAPGVETLFVMASDEYSSVSSSIVKEIASYKGDITFFVPQNVEKKIRQKFSI